MSLTPSKEIRMFVDRHRLKVLDSNKRAYRAMRMNVKYFQSPEDYNMVNTYTLPMETETLYTVEIAESELDSIARFEEQVFNNMTQKGHYNMFETLMEQKEKERRLRDTYPAVKKAYEQYSLMLKLAESGDM